jgi:hypothetical protein
VLLGMTGVILAGATAWSWVSLEMGVVAIFDGLGDLANLVGRMLPPKFVDLPRVLVPRQATFALSFNNTSRTVRWGRP